MTQRQSREPRHHVPPSSAHRHGPPGPRTLWGCSLAHSSSRRNTPSLHSTIQCSWMSNSCTLVAAMAMPKPTSSTRPPGDERAAGGAVTPRDTGQAVPAQSFSPAPLARMLPRSFPELGWFWCGLGQRGAAVRSWSSPKPQSPLLPRSGPLPPLTPGTSSCSQRRCQNPPQKPMGPSALPSPRPKLLWGMCHPDTRAQVPPPPQGGHRHPQIIHGKAAHSPRPSCTPRRGHGAPVTPRGGHGGQRVHVGRLPALHHRLPQDLQVGVGGIVSGCRVPPRRPAILALREDRVCRPGAHGRAAAGRKVRPALGEGKGHGALGRL